MAHSVDIAALSLISAALPISDNHGPCTTLLCSAAALDQSTVVRSDAQNVQW